MFRLIFDELVPQVHGPNISHFSQVFVKFIVRDGDADLFPLGFVPGWPWVFGLELPLDLPVPHRCMPFVFGNLQLVHVAAISIGVQFPKLVI